jgi:hypothetical protein
MNMRFLGIVLLLGWSLCFGGWNEKQKLTASDGGSEDYFGGSVSMSGGYALVGAPKEDSKGYDAGAAYVYKRGSDGSWSEVQKLTAFNGESGDRFGSSVSLSGGYALVGAPWEDSKGVRAGAAYVYKRGSDGNWSEVQKLTTSNRGGGEFGISVSLSGDYALVGAIDEDSEGFSVLRVGAAYVYKRGSDGNWSEVQKLTASNGESGDHFGSSVSLSGDYALVGVSHEDSEGINSGAAYVYRRGSESIWSEVQKITASNGSSFDEFGHSVSLSGDYALVGAIDEDSKGRSAGAAYVMKLDPFTLTSPNGGESWKEGEIEKIIWNDTSTADKVKLEYTVNNGLTWNTIVENLTNLGNYTWSTPSISVSTNVKVRISSQSDNTVYDISDDSFSILKRFYLTSPNGRESWRAGEIKNITWTNAGVVDKVKLEYATNNGSTWNTIVENLPNTNSYNWNGTCNL